MPHIDISTNASVAPKVGQKLLSDIVTLTETYLGKPKNVTMARLMPDSLVLFAGTLEPAAHVHIRAIGLPAPDTRNALVSSISALLDEVHGIAPGRTFVVFDDIPRNQWGVGGKLLG